APRLAVVYAAMEQLTLRATYGEAFRNPSIFEAAFDDRASVCANPDLLPERQRTGELGAALHLANGLNANASAYVMGITDLLVQATVPSCSTGPGPRAQFQNLGLVPVVGSEASVDSRSSGAIAQLAVSLNRALDRVMGGPAPRPPNSPVAVATASLS